ncbi:MAG: carboxypeptidase M32 [Desulfobacterales bacterium]|nr:carboxypeptidase M32 [Desulfobacterales bacterium]
MNHSDKLRRYTRELTALERIMALLQWDQEVTMPARAANDRAEQFAILSGIIHQKIIAPELGELLDRAAEAPDQAEIDRALIRNVGRERDRSGKLPESFVREFASLTGRALPAWAESRKGADFSLFAPFLEKIVAMCRQKADYLGYETEPYDALLDLHEEGLNTATVSRLFAVLVPRLTALLKNRAGRDQVRPVNPPMSQNDQIAFAERVLTIIGYDFTRGRQDLSAHPFSTAISHNDRRLTNRYAPDSLEFIFSAMHEGGHAMYEQGVAPELANTPLDDGVSLGIHESQSRLWENIIGRSRPFWEFLYPELQKTFAPQFAGLDLNDFFRNINVVHPGPIRVEADEVSYNLHVLIRFELEKGLMAGEIAVRDLPGLWNEKYETYLGVKVASDSDGLLQDIHWAHGSIGYFPTYTVGNLAAAQFWHAYCRFDPDYRQTLASGRLERVREWLTTAIYSHGSVYPPEELLLRVTGEKLNSRYFLDYLEKKYG